MEFSLDWPSAVAVVSSVVALTAGAIKLLGTGKTTSGISVESVHADAKSLAAEMVDIKVELARVIAGVDAIRSQIAELRSSSEKATSRLDLLVEKIADFYGRGMR
jgi:hypothetical protein